MLTTQTSRLINAPADIIYNAFTDPAAFHNWMAPGDKTGTARFITEQPYKKIVVGIRPDYGGPGYVGETIMEVRLERQGPATLVTIIFTNIPLGVKPEDNEKATQLSLDNLERYLKVS
jgi:uncharacterized protein YndB with AHSA1/START domain